MSSLELAIAFFLQVETVMKTSPNCCNVSPPIRLDATLEIG